MKIEVRNLKSMSPCFFEEAKEFYLIKSPTEAQEMPSLQTKSAKMQMMPRAP